MWEKYVTNVVLALIPITLLNFITFAVISHYLGGDAVNGKVESGRYYLVRPHHYTEVSYGVFLYSKIHAYLTFATFILLIGLMFLLEVKGKKHHLHER